MVNLRTRGMMLVLSSPSGAGKSSITRSLCKINSNIRLSISATTRPKRNSETDAVDYFFLSDTKFQTLVSQSAFIEYAEIYGNHYGTLESEVDKYLENGTDIIFDIDWQGAQKLRQKRCNDVVSIYILPPSMHELKLRLASRDQDAHDVITRRIDSAIQEMSHHIEYDYIVINDKLDDAVSAVQSILTAERLKRVRLSELDEFIASMN